MDHEQITEHNVVERYVLGRLTPEEEERFEEHLLECPECRLQVEREDDFQEGLHTVAAEEAVRATVRVGMTAGTIAWLGRRRGWLLVAALLLLAAFPLWLLRERSRLQGEIGHLQAALASPPAAPVPTPAPAPVAPSTPVGDPAEKEKLLAEIAAQKDANAKLSERLARLGRPQVNVPIFSLGFLRGEEGTANRVTLGKEPRWIVLSVELPPETAKSYRATLTTAGGKTLWEGDGLIPNADGTVTLSLDSGRLEPGPHRLRLTAVDAQGRTAPAGEIPFEVQRGAS
jgi:Putative zinc-finger